MNKILKITVIISLFGISSCDENFLDLKPTDRISEDYFWKQEKDAVLAVNACYPSLGIFRLFGFEGCSDNGATAKTWTDSYQIANGALNSSWPWVLELWRDSYKGVKKVNDVINNIDNIESIDETLKNRLVGEALFIRAYIYNILINTYGDVPYFDKSVTDIEERKLPRENKDVILERIITDLDKAINYLPVSYDEQNIGRITKGAALALKVRVYLWQNKFSEALTAAKSVIDLNQYSLKSKYNELFLYSTENNEEIILDDQYMPSLRTNNVFEALAPRSSEGLSNYVPTRSLIDAYEGNDPRLNYTILQPMEVNPWEDGNIIFNPTPGSGNIDEVSISYNATITGYHFKKYVLKEDRDFPTRCSINLVHIRYADVLLMFAEAENEVNGPTDAAYSAINQVRTRARVGFEDENSILPDLSGLSKEEFREAVRNERRIELAGEGLRYFDILRWGIAENVLNGAVYGMDYIDNTTGEQKTVFVENRVFNVNKNYLWPLPESELRLNPSLNQNPGY